MDTVDVLTMAVDVARMIRSAADPEAVFAEACRVAGCSLGHACEPLSLRIARLVEDAGDRRGEMNEVLRSRRGPLYLNRPINPEGASVGIPEPDSELSELLDFIGAKGDDDDDENAIDLIGEGMSPYKIGSREI